MKFKDLTDFLGVIGDMFIALLAMLGQEVKQAFWATRIVLYVLQALFTVLDCGHGKAANISIR